MNDFTQICASDSFLYDLHCAHLHELDTWNNSYEFYICMCLKAIVSFWCSFEGFVSVVDKSKCV